MRRLSKELEKAAYRMFLDGASKKQISRELGISLPQLSRYAEKGFPELGKRAWRDRRAEVWRKREDVEDGAVVKSIMERGNLLTDIERQGLRKLHRRVKAAGKELTVAELTAVSRETTQALRLAVDSTRVGPQTQINVNAHAQAGAMAGGQGGAGILSEDFGGTRITVATVKALQDASPEEKAALRAWQKRTTLALEGHNPTVPSARADEVAEVVGANVGPARKKGTGA